MFVWSFGPLVGVSCLRLSAFCLIAVVAHWRMTPTTASDLTSVAQWLLVCTSATLQQELAIVHAFPTAVPIPK